MKRFLGGIFVGLCALSTVAAAMPEGRWSQQRARNGFHQVEDVSFVVPTGWQLIQDVRHSGTILMGLSRGDDFLGFYVKDAAGFDFKGMFTGTVVKDIAVETVGPFGWDTMELRYSAPDGGPTVHVKGFTAEFRGKRYYGYARSSDQATAAEMARTFLAGLRVTPVGPESRSLTGVGYTGKKYYLGFGDHLSGFMGNEVKYDIAHTHDIFTKDVGGNYIGTKLVGPGMGGTALRQKWRELGSVMTSQDMYVQYSSGHGSHTGLMFGVSYDEIRDNALAYPASEVIIFTMACYSGNLVNSFDRKKSEWQGWQQQGRTLFVMASSKPNETSSTGPITDPQEPGGPAGSAGSAFGHALWKALIGDSDGHVDGVKDGFIALGEIRDFSTWKTKKMKGHTPVSTGSFHTALVMNRVPSREFLETLPASTEGLTDEQVMDLIRALDEELRVR